MDTFYAVWVKENMAWKTLVAMANQQIYNGWVVLVGAVKIKIVNLRLHKHNK